MMRALTWKVGFTLFCALIIQLPLLSAHLAAGEDITVDGFAIDMGHDPKVIVAGEPFSLSLALSNASTEEQLFPRAVWVRIMKGGNVMFAGTFSPESGTVMTVMSLPNEGDYTIDARFFNEGPQALVVAKFPLEVHAKRLSGAIVGWIVLALGLSILGILGWVWYKAKTTPHHSSNRRV